MDDVLRLEIDTVNAGQRIDKFISESLTEFTRSAIQSLLEKGMITVNNSVVTKSYKLRNNDLIYIQCPEPENLDVTAENIPLNIIYEDDDLLVVNKPKGMVVHPAHGNYSGTLVNALLFHCKDSLSGINGVRRPGIVHRIDKNTSGLLIIAKNDNAHVKLSEQIKAHSFTREYDAIAMGRFKETTGTINAPIGRHHVDRKKMCVTAQNSKNAVTHYEVIRQYEKFAHLRLRLETGRTHQIRVHLSHIGHAVIGDDVYGKPYKFPSGNNIIEGQCLHARKIGFVHPRTEKYMEFESPLPDYFITVLKNSK